MIKKRKLVTPRTVDKDQKRRDILEAAIKVFAERGVNHFKMIDIAKEAKIGKGTIYEYFRDKDDLILGCFGYFVGHYTEILGAMEESNLPPDKRLERMIRESFDFFITNMDFTRIIYDLWALLVHTDGDKHIMDQFGPMQDKALQQLESVIQEGKNQGIFGDVDPKGVALIIHGMIDGILFQYKTGLIDYDYKKMIEGIIEMIMHGILKKS